MLWTKKRIAGQNVAVLDVSGCNETDVKEFQIELPDIKAVQLGLGDLPMLAFFPNADTLIVTGGECSASGVEFLYRQSSLKHLVLDYEETDSDEDGIILSRFPALQTVVSRSNLNLYHYGSTSDRSIDIEVCNWYEKGRPKKITLPDSIELCRARAPVFFSTEASSPMAHLLMRILKEYERRIEKYDIKRYSSNLDFVGIILICMKPNLLAEGFGKERCIVNLARREADLRLKIDYTVFAAATDEERQQLCLAAIEHALEIIASKDKSFRQKILLQDLSK